MSVEDRYAGMSLNERLFTARLLDAFDAAVKAKSRAKVVRLLEQVSVDDPEWTAETILKRPEEYDF
ncbi:hypothetical protein [Sphingomicrobium aestuariivivum]|uniref:hypothetical protein n=1 Tax=Sphingomicrobium aestuariivivum TaxID=1582356 RepID=UPI001FD6D19C|nr:hypothetical protein [Sphingomicrobium aestuariivivum]MCJ8190237.1 hypothetical protein [Sphingomicrobium aestuariivivum]